MAEVIQNVLYLLTQGAWVNRDHLTFQIEIPEYPPEMPAEQRHRQAATGHRKLAIPVHHVESVCVFGQIAFSPPALELCHEHGIAVSFLSENGYLVARLASVPDSSVALRRAHFRAADQSEICVRIARNMVAGKIQNARSSLLRAARETEAADETTALQNAAIGLARQLDVLQQAPDLDVVRGIEGVSAAEYFGVFSGMLKQQRTDFEFTTRSRRPPLDRINCLLSFLYALVRHDCTAGLTCIGLDPFVGFLHAERPNRPALALDLMEEFRPWLADRLAITLVNRQQVVAKDFERREGGAVGLTDAGRRSVVKAYQERKKESLHHGLLDQDLRVGQIPFVQARLLARILRRDASEYVAFLPQ